MAENEIHEGGMLVAVFFSLFATCGYVLTTGRTTASYDWLWIALYAASLLMMSLSVVNFDVKKLFR